MVPVDDKREIRLIGANMTSDSDVPVDHPALQTHLAKLFGSLAGRTGSAGRGARLTLCAEQPDLDAGEVPDTVRLHRHPV